MSQLILVVKHGTTKGYAPLATKDIQSHLGNVLLLIYHVKQQILMASVHHVIQAMFFIKRTALLYQSWLTLRLIMLNAVQKSLLLLKPKEEYDLSISKLILINSIKYLIS